MPQHLVHRRLQQVDHGAVLHLQRAVLRQEKLLDHAGVGGPVVRVHHVDQRHALVAVTLADVLFVRQVDADRGIGPESPAAWKTLTAFAIGM